MLNKLENRWKILMLSAFFLTLLLINIYELNVSVSSFLIFVLSLLLFQPNRRDLLTVLALFFVFVLDFFLGWQNYTVVLIFYLTFHLLCAGRLHLNMSKQIRLMDLSLRISLAALAEVIGFILFKSDFSFLYAFALFYFANLVMNVLSSGIQLRKNGLLFAGMVVFLISDIFVGLDQMGIFYVNYVIEITYLSALTLIALSLLWKPTTAESVTIWSNRNG